MALLDKNLPLFLALRYLRPKRTFVSVITLISILGVALGVAVLIVVIAVMSGFEQQIRKTALGVEPHVTLEYFPTMGTDSPAAAENSKQTVLTAQPITLDDASNPDQSAASLSNQNSPSNNENNSSNWRELAATLEKEELITSSSPFINGIAFLERRGEPMGVRLRAIDESNQSALERMSELIDMGSFELRGESVVLGRSVAEQLGVAPGDQLTLYAADNIREMVQAVRKINDSDDSEAAKQQLQGLVLPYEIEVSGILARNPLYDRDAFVPLYLAQELLQLGGEVQGLGLWTENPETAIKTREFLQDKLPAGWYSQAWMESPEIKHWFDTIRSERAMMYLVLFMIVLVAAFSIMNTMITVAVQKRREIGVVTAMGAKVSHVIWIFLAQGMIVGVLGAGLGVGLGLLVLKFRNAIRSFLSRVFGWEIFDERIYGIVEIPSKIRWADIGVIAGGSFLLCALAALLPAYLAARTDPARALRNE